MNFSTAPQYHNQQPIFISNSLLHPASGHNPPDRAFQPPGQAYPFPFRRHLQPITISNSLLQAAASERSLYGDYYPDVPPGQAAPFWQQYPLWVPSPDSIPRPQSSNNDYYTYTLRNHHSTKIDYIPATFQNGGLSDTYWLNALQNYHNTANYYSNALREPNPTGNYFSLHALQERAPRGDIRYTHALQNRVTASNVPYSHALQGPEPTSSDYYMQAAQNRITSNNYYPGTMQDHNTIVIGSKSKFANPASRSTQPPRKKSIQRPYIPKITTYTRKPADPYGVVHDKRADIQLVPQGLLVRFSGKAQKTFPKPANLEKKDRVDAENEVQNITRNLELDLKNDAVYEQPPVKAFEDAFKWMSDARKVASAKSAAKDLLPYGVSDPEACTLRELVDTYAVALALELRPHFKKAKQDLLKRLTQHPPSLEDVKDVHWHIPVDDIVTTRMITSYVQNRGKGRGHYTWDERKEIEGYFYNVEDHEDPALVERFEEILEHHKERKRQPR